MLLLEQHCFVSRSFNRIACQQFLSRYRMSISIHSLYHNKLKRFRTESNYSHSLSITMYVKSIAYAVAAVSIFVSAAAQPLPSDGIDLAGATAAAPGYTGHHHHHHKHHKHHHHHSHGHKHRKHHHGDMTYYTPGLGSCGATSGSNDMIVAVAEDLLAPRDGGNPTTNP